MKKLDGTSLDITEKNIEKIKELFPQVVTEDQIDFDKLRLILGDDIDLGAEKYQFTWPGKADSIRLSQEPSTKTLRPVIEDSKNWDNTENLYIEGDNLEVLKQLQKTYHGKIDMIYIDPPYNTGNDFVYNDKFSQTSEDYKIETNQGLISNPETSGRYHSNWLNMIYPRLILAKNLLSSKGVIFISIDDNEQSNLKKIMDEIFGENNFIATFLWQKTYSPKNNNKFVSEDHDYIICYAKNKLILDNFDRLPRDEKSDSFYKYDDGDGRGAYGLDNLTIKGQKGYDISWNGKIYKEPKTGGWRYNEKRMYELIKEGRIYLPTDQSKRPRYKRYLSEVPGLISKTILPYYQVSHSDEAKKSLDSLLGINIFDYPKPVKLIHYFTFLIENKDAVVLDFFSGSSTTAHAVMKKNGEDGGNRQFIMVQLPEETGEKSEAYKAGYKNICEIGKERIRRAGEQVKSELLEAKNKGEEVRDPDTLDIGFKVFRLDETNIVPWEGKKAKSSSEQIDLLEMLEDVFKKDRSAMDVAYEIMLKYGVFDQHLQKISINGKEMFDVGDGYMLICLAEEVTLEDIKQIGEQGYLHVIFNDRSFADDNVKLNAEHSLKNMGVEEVVSI